MSEPASIGLIVDNPGRDLAGLVLLGADLARRGHRTTLIPMNLRGREIAAVDPDLVVLNYLRAANQPMVEGLLDAGYQIGLLDTEGGIGIIGQWGDVHDHYGKIMAPDRAVRDQLAFLCAWGPRVAGYVVDQGWYRDETVVLTGAPRFDWYHRSLRTAAIAANPITVPDEGYVLVIGSFPAANPGVRSMEEEIRQRIENTGYAREKIEGLIERDREAMEATIEATRTLARDHPDVTFVFRPHPFELAATYHDRFGEFENIEVRFEGSAEAWVLRSDAVIVPNDCTIAVESAMADIPALITSWVVPDNAIDAVTAAGTPCGSLEELRHTLGAVLDGRQVERDADGTAMLEAWFHLMDGVAHDRVAEVISGRARPGRRHALRRRRLHYITTVDEATTLQLAQEYVRMATSLPARFSFPRLRTPTSIRWDSSVKAFGEATARPLVDALNGTLPSSDRIRVRSLRPDEYSYRHQGRSLAVEVGG